MIEVFAFIEEYISLKKCGFHPHIEKRHGEWCIVHENIMDYHNREIVLRRRWRTIDGRRFAEWYVRSEVKA